MEEKETKSIDIKNLLALCNIVDDYKKFTNSLVKFLDKKDNRDLVYKLDRFIKGELKFSNKAIRKFYEENIETINKIEEYSDIVDYITSNYDSEGKIRKSSNLNYFYEYLLENKEKVEDIKELLLKLQDLSIDYLKFNPNVEFTKTEYYVYKNFGSNYDINYLDNIKVKPDFRDSIIIYESEGSNYLISANVNVQKTGFTDYSRKILLNSLTFGKDRLPNDISREDIFDKIIELSEKEINSSKLLENLVSLSVGIDDFEEQYEKLKYMIDRLEKIEDKKKLKEILLVIKNEIKALRAVNKKNNKKAVKDNDFITKEVIDSQKKKYLSIREFQYLDLD